MPPAEETVCVHNGTGNVVEHICWYIFFFGGLLSGYEWAGPQARVSSDLRGNVK